MLYFRHLNGKWVLIVLVGSAIVLLNVPFSKCTLLEISMTLIARTVQS